MGWIFRRAMLPHLGLLVIRLGLGGMFLFAFGLPKLMEGSGRWAGVGAGIRNVGINFGSDAFWGFLAAAAEVFGGLLIATGLLFRPACILLVWVMFVAALTVLNSPRGFSGATHAIDVGIVFFGLLIAGPGEVSLKRRIPMLRNRWYG